MKGEVGHEPTHDNKIPFRCSNHHNSNHRLHIRCKRIPLQRMATTRNKPVPVSVVF